MKKEKHRVPGHWKSSASSASGHQGKSGGAPLGWNSWGASSKGSFRKEGMNRQDTSYPGERPQTGCLTITVRTPSVSTLFEEQCSTTLLFKWRQRCFITVVKGGSDSFFMHLKTALSVCRLISVESNLSKPRKGFDCFSKPESQHLTGEAVLEAYSSATSYHQP